jgi:branched-chain amino acid transport system permease protein
MARVDAGVLADAAARPWRAALALGALAVVLVAVPPFLAAYPLTLLTQALIYGVFAMSLDVLLGYTGLPSLGHAAYFGVAAYAVAILATEYKAGPWLCLVVAVTAALLTAAVFGLLAIRASGTYFLMITLALGMVVWGLAFRWVSMTKGDNGISGVERPAVAGWALADATVFYYACLLVFAAAAAALAVLVRSPFGMSLQGIRDSEARMRSLGYNVWLHKYLAFILSAGFAGVAGVLWAYYNGFVSPVEVQLVTSVEALLMVALGGSGTLVGPALGAGIIVFLKNFVSVYTKRWLLILGGVYICVILFAPGGLMGLIRRKGR